MRKSPYSARGIDDAGRGVVMEGERRTFRRKGERKTASDLRGAKPQAGGD